MTLTYNICSCHYSHYLSLNRKLNFCLQFMIINYATLWIWISQNVLINGEIWPIQIAEKRLLWIRVNFHWLLQWKVTDLIVENIVSPINQWKLSDLTVKNIVSIDDSVKRQITDSISENLTDLDLERKTLISNSKR